MKTIELNKEEFARRIADIDNLSGGWEFSGSRPALVDFYASWCGHCRALAPVLEELAADYEGKVDIYKVDVDKERELAGAFGVRSIPTLLFIPVDGTPHVFQGALPREDLEKAIEEILMQPQE